MRPGLRQIVDWQPVLTDHQAYTYAELSRIAGVPLVVYVARLEDPARQAQGWTDTREKAVRRVLIPKQNFISFGLKRLLENRRDVHFFGSAFENPRMMLLLAFAALIRPEFYIISEPYSPLAVSYFNDRAGWSERVKAKLRPYVYKAYAHVLKSRISGLFTISALAAEQFATAGISRRLLFPFGYFVPQSIVPPLTQGARTPGVLKLVFVGSLIERKGLRSLIAAVHRAIESGAAIVLDVYGPGRPDDFEFDDQSVRYMGRIPFGETQNRLVGYDMLVLPSAYDGWGVVVNEAICAHVPVLCSDRVGARVLVENFAAGRVVPVGDVDALAAALVDLSRDRRVLDQMKSNCRDAARAIQPANAAAYLFEVMSATTPASRAAIPPNWCRRPQ